MFLGQVLQVMPQSVWGFRQFWSTDFRALGYTPSTATAKMHSSSNVHVWRHMHGVFNSCCSNSHFNSRVLCSLLALIPISDGKPSTKGEMISHCKFDSHSDDYCQELLSLSVGHLYISFNNVYTGPQSIFTQGYLQVSFALEFCAFLIFQDIYCSFMPT